MNQSWCSPKLIALANILANQTLDTFQGIILVEQRQTAECLAEVLPRMDLIRGKVRCACFLGQGTDENGSDPMPTTRQRAVMKMFRDGRLNLGPFVSYSASGKSSPLNTVIATSVAEEGLDFPVSMEHTHIYFN